MNILFICGSLEEGKDGVGDYTLLIARQLSLLGHKVSVISFYDRYIEWMVEDTILNNKTPINSLRLSSNISSVERFNLINKKIKTFSPDWVSIQYVPFAFHHKGLSAKFHRDMIKLLEHINVHIMFHELWVGSYGSFGVTSKLLEIGRAHV